MVKLKVVIWQEHWTKKRFKLSSSFTMNDSYDFRSHTTFLIEAGKIYNEVGLLTLTQCFTKWAWILPTSELHDVLECWFLRLTPYLLSQNLWGKS